VRTVRRLAVGMAVTCMLALGGVAASGTVASAGTIGSCGKSGILATCAVSGAPGNPVTITAAVTSSPDKAEISWSINCTSLTGSQASSSGSFTGKTPFTHTIPHPFSRPDECGVVVIAALSSGTGNIHLTLSWSSTPPATAIKGYGGKCADDAGNSSAARNKIQVWSCTGGAAQDWSFSNGELIHNGKCLNDQASGGSRSKIVLWSCDRAPNETWTHNSRNEYVLTAHGSTLCLDDPGYSTKNGTQLIVYTCDNGSNQHWSLP
jgi:Ricin-type beta-trefoil lectin domain